VAFRDFVEEFAISDRGEVIGFGEVRRECAMLTGFRAVAFARLAVAVGAVVFVDGECCAEIVGGRLERIGAMFGFVRDDPFARLEGREDDGDEDESKDCGKEKLAEFGCHVEKKIFA